MESYPPVPWLMNIETLVLTVDLAVTSILAPATLSPGLRGHGEHCLRQSPMIKRAFLENQEFNREVSFIRDYE